MKKFVAMIATVMFVFLAVVPMAGAAGATSAEQKMYVSSSNGKGVRIRTLPCDAGEIIMNLGEGRPVTVMDKTNDTWSEVKVQVNGKYVYGYIMSKFLSVKDPSVRPQTFKDVKPFNAKVRTASANGRVSLWDTTSKETVNKIRDIDKSENLTVIAESHAWYKVNTPDGEIGYVAKAYMDR